MEITFSKVDFVALLLPFILIVYKEQKRNNIIYIHNIRSNYEYDYIVNNFIKVGFIQLLKLWCYKCIGAVAAPYLAKQNLPANALESNWATNGNADKVSSTEKLY